MKGMTSLSLSAMLRLSRPSIRTCLMLMSFFLLFLLFPSTFILLLHQEASNRDIELARDLNQIRYHLESRRATLARNMALSAGQAISGYDFTFLNILVDQVVDDDPEILYCIIMSRDRAAIAHSDHDRIGTLLNRPIDHQVEVMLARDFPQSLPEKPTVGSLLGGYGIRFLDVDKDNDTEQGIMEAISPVYNGDSICAAVRLGFSLNSIHEEIENAKADWDTKVDQYTIFLAMTIGFFLSVAVIVVVVLTRLFVKPLHILTDGVTRLTDGDLSHPIKQRGLVFKEFMELSHAFNVMTERLKASYDKLGDTNRLLEKKVAERTRELKAAQDHLLLQAHEAGRAEMAVGMLHNIGNAITPAGVSTSLLLKRLKESPIRQGFDHASFQIQAAIAHSSICAGEKGDKLCRIVNLLSESICEEYDAVMDEIRKIQYTHEHVESIIQLQMQYGVFGELDRVHVDSVVEDALKMLADAISKHHISVVKQFSPVPFVRIQKARLLQILINVFKNSIESMSDVPKGRRTLTVSIEKDHANPEKILLTINDSGVGFSREEKDKLFVFGYTTKSRGSGFGLHSCANYLIAGNGSITASSEGKGKGAEFFIRLPQNPGRNLRPE